MRRIIVGAQVSMDGVMQAPGGPTEDPTGRFRFGGWAMPYFNREFGEEIDRLFGEKFDLLLGRKTYEIFAAYWPYYDESGPHGGIARRFNEIKKYAVSRSGEVDTSWAGTVLLRDIAGVKRLKQEDGPNLVTQGSTELVHALLANDLVDAMSLFTVPVVLGGGKKLFADGSAPHSFRLTGSRVAPNGLMVAHYERAGAVEIGDAAPGPPSEREVARRKRMTKGIQRLDHVSVVVDDLAAAVAFFTALGMTLEGEMPVEGAWVDRVNGIEGVRVDISMMRTPDGHGRLELTRFRRPGLVAIEPAIAPPNAPGLRSVMFTVESVDDAIARLRAHGGELVGEVAQYEDKYRLCYMRGPAGIIVALAEELS